MKKLFCFIVCTVMTFAFSSCKDPFAYNGDFSYVPYSEATIQTTVAETTTADGFVFEYIEGMSLYDPDTMYIPNTALYLDDSLVGTVCIDKTGVWNDMSTTAKIFCEADQEYVLIGANGNVVAVCAVGIYDVNGVLLKWYDAPNKTIIVTPSDAVYMRVSFANAGQGESLRSIQRYEENIGFYGYAVGEYPKPTDSVSTQSKIKPTVIIMHDGGNYDNRAAILAEYGLHGTFCINSDSVAHLDEEFENLLSEGHDIALYGGLGKQPDTYVASEVDKEAWYEYIKAGVDALKAKGVDMPIQYGCRGHKGSKYITEVCKELGFKYISCTYELHSGETMNDDADIEWVSTYENDPDNILFSPSILSEDMAKNRKYVDDAIENNYIVGLFTHNVEDVPTVSYDLSTAAYRDILSYVKEKSEALEIEVLTMREFYYKYHN